MKLPSQFAKFAKYHDTPAGTNFRFKVDLTPAQRQQWIEQAIALDPELRAFNDFINTQHDPRETAELCFTFCLVVGLMEEATAP